MLIKLAIIIGILPLKYTIEYLLQLLTYASIVSIIFLYKIVHNSTHIT